jgi:RimJ/RimL family protein N-acetyltransferase
LTRDEVRARLAAEIATAAASGLQYWPIFLRDGGSHVGCAGLRPRDPGVPELGFHIRTAMAGRGLATEAARAVIEHAFDSLGCTALFAGHNPDNTASHRVLDKLGFVHTHDELYPPTGRLHPCYRLRRVGTRIATPTS